MSLVNNDTIKLAPREAMQFGRALQRVLTKLVHSNPRYGPPHLGKIDIADGFYRIPVRAYDVPKLGVALPRTQGPPLVAFPLTLPMGWVESPPYFTSATETACDLANRALRTGLHPQRAPHRLTQLAASTPPSGAALPAARYTTNKAWGLANAAFGLSPALPPLASVDVYVDDFLLMAQTTRHRAAVLQHTLHSIDAVFQPLSPTDPATRKEPTSTKKLLQGDAHWSHQKRILGWDVDTVQGTLALPPHRVARLYELLDSIRPPRRRLARSAWHQLLGELRSMAPALPGSRGLFSVLQAALALGDKHRVRLTRRVFDTISDFRALADSLTGRPTRFLELVPVAPSDIGACDACKAGMGGVWFDSADRTQPPVLWRAAFPPNIQATLVTADNRSGTLSISDLELAAAIAHKAVLAATRHTHERTIWLASDNRAALSWASKGSSTATSARAYLLRLNALHQRAHRYLARHHYIPGPLNCMADDASRLWHLSDAALVSHFNSLYPQHASWRMLTLPTTMLSAVIGALLRQRRVPASLTSVAPPRTPIGASGRPFVAAWPSTPTCPASMTSYLFSSSLPTATAKAPSPMAAATPSALARWKMPYERWARRSPAWGPLTLASTPTAPSIFASNPCSGLGPEPIPPQPASAQFPLS